MDLVLASPVFSNRSCVIMGNINIDLASTDPYVENFEAVLSTYGFANCIRQPTTQQTATMLDVCITNADAQELNSGIFSYDLSDHFPVFLLLSISKRQVKQK